MTATSLAVSLHEACSEDFKIGLQNAMGYGQRAWQKMATENDASAACPNFEQIYTLSTLCMPVLQFQHANMHALIHAVFARLNLHSTWPGCGNP